MSSWHYGKCTEGGHNKRNTYKCGNNLKPLDISSNEEERFKNWSKLHIVKTLCNQQSN
jgi:hypothetical protein